MKESIGGVFLFEIVIAFVLFFTGIMCLTINHAKAFAVKDDIVNAITADKGKLTNDGTLDVNKTGTCDLNQKIVDAMSKDAYWTTGKCEGNFTGYNRDGCIDNKNPAICIKKTDVNLNEGLSARSYISDDTKRGCYYEVEVFYKLDIPIMQSVFNFNVKGQTKIMYENC